MSTFNQPGFCPICKSTNRQPSNIMSSRNLNLGSGYLSSLCTESEREMIKAIKQFECLNCGVVYLDPWLDLGSLNQIFIKKKSDHMAGWAEYETYLTDQRQSSVAQRNNRILNAISPYLKPAEVVKYAELGCPFQGLLIQPTKSTKKLNLIFRFLVMSLKEFDRRQSFATRLYNCLHNLCIAILYFPYLIRLLKNRFQHSHHPSINLSFNPQKKFLLSVDSSFFWSKNCTRYGNSCSSHAATVLEAKVLPVDEFIEHVDLVGVFNILDHIDNPLHVLERLFEKTRFVIYVCHTVDRSGKQHKFAFTPKFYNWLQKKFPEKQFVDLAGDVYRGLKQDYDIFLIKDK